MDWEDPLEQEMATHSSVLAWKIPGTEEPGYGVATSGQPIPIPGGLPGPGIEPGSLLHCRQILYQIERILLPENITTQGALQEQ